MTVVSYIDNVTGGEILTMGGSYNNNAEYLEKNNFKMLRCAGNRNGIKMELENKNGSVQHFLYDENRGYLIRL